MIKIVPVNWHSPAAYCLRKIRQEVFINEQQVPATLEWEPEDETAHHWLIYLHDTCSQAEPLAIGCGRLLNNGKIGRIALLKPHRRNGYGHQLMHAIIDYAKQQNTFANLHLHAQSYSIPFYEQLGFTTQGSPFMEAGIEHIAMQLSLVEQRTLGIHYGEFTVSNVLHELTQFSQQAHRYLYISMHELDHALLADAQILQNLSALARRHANSEIRILCHSLDVFLSTEHPLILLARRLSSSISLRENQNQKITNKTVIIADNKGYIVESPYDKTRLLASYYQPIAVQSLKEAFMQQWSHAQSPKGLPALSL